jgi:HEAT repeat protein
VILDIVHDREVIYSDRREAVQDLERIGPAAEAALPTLLRLLESRERYMAERAAYAAAAVGGGRPEVVEGLVRLLVHREWIMRAAAVESLGRLGAAARRAIAEVQARTCDRNEYVRERARRALASIRGE